SGLEPTDAVGAAQDVGRVDGAGAERLRRRQLELGRGERADEREALAEGAARVEVRRERDGRAGLDKRAGGRHRPAEEERARREEHAGDVARRERAHAVLAGRLEVVDRARAEVDGELDGSLLGELIAVQAERQAGSAARLEIPARLHDVERAALDEDVGSFGHLGRVRQYVGEREVEVRIRVVELRRNRVRSEPRRDAARGPDRAERGELGVEIEPVAGLPLERRRSGTQHPFAVATDDVEQLLLRGRARRTDGRHDSAAVRMQLLVARTARSQRELVDAVAGEARVRVTVDEARDRAETTPVDLDRVAFDAIELAHPSGSRDDAVVAQQERVLDYVDAPEVRATKRRTAAGWRHELCEVADEQAGGTAVGRHSSDASRRIGTCRSCTAAAASASS